MSDASPPPPLPPASGRARARTAHDRGAAGAGAGPGSQQLPGGATPPRPKRMSLASLQSYTPKTPLLPRFRKVRTNPGEGRPEGRGVKFAGFMTPKRERKVKTFKAAARLVKAETRIRGPKNVLTNDDGNIVLTPSKAVGYFDRPDFNVDRFAKGHLNSLGVRAVRQLHNELGQVKTHAAEEMQAKVFNNYKSLVGVSNSIHQMEEQLHAVRQALQSIKGAAGSGKAAEARRRNTVDFADEAAAAGAARREGGEREEENAAGLRAMLEGLDIAIGEKQAEGAKVLLTRLERELARREAAGDPLADSGPGGGRALDLAGRRRRVVALLASGLHPTAPRAAVRGLVGEVLEVTGEVPALRLLLDHHRRLLLAFKRGLREAGPARDGGSAAAVAQVGFASAAMLAQVAAAVEDALDVFRGRPAPQWASHLHLWAAAQVDLIASVLRGELLAGAVADGDVRAVAGGILLAAGNCAALLGPLGLLLDGVLANACEASLTEAVKAKLARTHTCWSKALEMGVDVAPDCACGPAAAGFKTALVGHFYAAVAEIEAAVKEVDLSHKAMKALASGVLSAATIAIADLQPERMRGVHRLEPLLEDVRLLADARLPELFAHNPLAAHAWSAVPTELAKRLESHRDGWEVVDGADFPLP